MTDRYELAVGVGEASAYFSKLSDGLDVTVYQDEDVLGRFASLKLDDGQARMLRDWLTKHYPVVPLRPVT